jgi:hypothetical protein
LAASGRVLACWGLAHVFHLLSVAPRYRAWRSASSHGEHSYWHTYLSAAQNSAFLFNESHNRLCNPAAMSSPLS